MRIKIHMLSLILTMMVLVMSKIAMDAQAAEPAEAAAPAPTIQIEYVVEAAAPEADLIEGVIEIAEPELVSLGEFRLTAYCSCGKCCGKWADNRPTDANGNELVYGDSGELLTAGYSIAVDPDIIPFGTEVIINGNTYAAHDTGSGIDGNSIDIYFTDHNEALVFGVQYAEVFIEEVD